MLFKQNMSYNINDIFTERGLKYFIEGGFESKLKLKSLIESAIKHAHIARHSLFIREKS